MEAGSRKRCRVAAMMVSLAVVFVFLYIYGEVIAVELIGTSQKYIKNSASVLRKPTNASSRHNTTNLIALDLSNSSAVNKMLSPASNVDTIPTNHITKRNATIVVLLSGEMGNHLSILAKAWSIKIVAAKQYGIAANLVLRHQSHPKWTRGQESIQTCFPKLRHYNFSAANSLAFDQLVKKQNEVLVQKKWDPARLRLDSDKDNTTTIHEALAYWKIMLDSSSLPYLTMNTSVSFPFLAVASWCPLDMLDQQFDEIRNFFEFDKVACCRLQPDPDESVFHLRNFVVEMPRKGKVKGYEELSPNKTANELFTHLNSSDKVAITTRFGGDNVAPYVSAMKERGLQVRVIDDQTGTQDFCFLLTAQKELVGTLMSTYVMWGAILGDTKRANLYRVKSPNTQQISFPALTWTHPKLKDRIYSQEIKSEEQEAWEANKQEGRMLLYRDWVFV